MPVQGIDGPTPGGEPQPGRHKRKIAIGSYRQRKVVTTFLGKMLGHKLPKKTPAEKKAIRKTIRMQRAAKKAAKKAEKAEAIKAAKAEMRKDYTDQFTVVLELARIANQMEVENYSNEVEYIQAITNITTLITTLLRDIEKQQEREAERKQEEHDQEVADQKAYDERRRKEEDRKAKAMEDIRKANREREELLDNNSSAPAA